MFVEYFDFFLECMRKIFHTLDTFVLFPGFTFYNFLVALIIIPIFYKIFGFLMGIEYYDPDNIERRTMWKMQRYDEIRLHDNLRIKDERDLNRRL